MTEKELKAFSYKNHKKSCLHFWPELNGNVLKGWVLHHKDPTLKYKDPIRYAEWRIEDIEPLTRSIHNSLHLIGNTRTKGLHIKNTIKNKVLNEESNFGKKNRNLTDVEKYKISLATQEAMNRPEIKAKLNAPEMKERKSKAMSGLIFWHKGDKNKRSRECPGIGWERGKAKTGRHHSEETRAKLSKKALLREARKRLMKKS